MTSVSKGKGRRYVETNQPEAELTVVPEEQNKPRSTAPATEVRWRRTSVGKPDQSGSFSTTIRFREERYHWLHQAAATTGRSKSELVDEGLELLAQRMGYGARPAG